MSPISVDSWSFVTRWGPTLYGQTNRSCSSTTHLLPQQDQHPGRYLIQLSFALTLAHVDLACERRIRQVMAAPVRRLARPRVFLPRFCAVETVESVAHEKVMKP